MNEIVTREETGPAGAFARNQPPAPGANVGAVAIESERAIAEAQGQLVLAKRFPRDLDAAHDELMRSCSMLAFANVAFYSVPRGDKTVSGESIRLAEELARVYGNFEFGHRELSRSGDKSEVEVYAWDKEKNNRSIRQITVMHVRDTRQGSYKLRDQKEIDDKIANVGSKQVRGRILALMPKWLVEAAKERCHQTLLEAADKDGIAKRLPKMVSAFAAYKVTEEQLTEYVGRPLQTITSEEFVELTGIYNALREGANPADYFGGVAATAMNDNEPQAKALPAATAGQAPHPAAAAAKRKQSAKTQQEDEKPAETAKDFAPAPAPAPQPAPAPAPEPAAAEDPPGVMF